MARSSAPLAVALLALACAASGAAGFLIPPPDADFMLSTIPNFVFGLDVEDPKMLFSNEWGSIGILEEE